MAYFSLKDVILSQEYSKQELAGEAEAETTESDAWRTDVHEIAIWLMFN